MAKRFKWADIVSPAKTAYGHLSWIRKLILAEPKRYNQSMWLVGTRVTPEEWESPMYRQIERYAPQGLPECGTVGCVAGWTVASLGVSHPRTQRNVSTKAQQILGLTTAQADELFNGNVIQEMAFKEGIELPSPQTPEFARLGAEHIANFQAKYRRQLQHTKLPGR